MSRRNYDMLYDREKGQRTPCQPCSLPAVVANRLLFVFGGKARRDCSSGPFCCRQKGTVRPRGAGEARDFFIQNRKIFLYFVTENRKPLRKRKKQMKSSDFLPGRPGYRRYLEHPGTVGNSCLARTRQYPNQGEATV